MRQQRDFDLKTNAARQALKDLRGHAHSNGREWATKRTANGLSDIRTVGEPDTGQEADMPERTELPAKLQHYIIALVQIESRLGGAPKPTDLNWVTQRATTALNEAPTSQKSS